LPQGALKYLTRLCGWASDRGFYIIIDFHGAPGAQQPNQPFTGQYAPSVGFYNDYNYGRSVEWLKWMTDLVHTTEEFRNVGMIEVINEPLNWNDAVESLRSKFYVDAYNAIRGVEESLGIAPNDQVHIQLMSSHWGSGKPDEFLPGAHFLAFDDHRYLKWDTSIPVNKDAFIAASCGDDRNAETPTIIGEWSLSVPDNVEWTDEWNPNTQQDFYRRWFAAQIQAYERSLGWVFWSWKVNLGDYRWSYKDAVAAGVISADLNSVANSQVC
jgi:aryl-phospho-beta-D-glucosidase BglC (GH1 family)